MPGVLLSVNVAAPHCIASARQCRWCKRQEAYTVNMLMYCMTWLVHQSEHCSVLHRTIISDPTQLPLVHTFAIMSSGSCTTPSCIGMVWLHLFSSVFLALWFLKSVNLLRLVHTGALCMHCSARARATNIFFENAGPFSWNCEHMLYCCCNYMWRTNVVSFYTDIEGMLYTIWTYFYI